MPDYTIRVFIPATIGGFPGLVDGGEIVVRDDNGNRDDIFDDIESAGSGETNGDQEIVTSSVTGLDPADTIRTRGLYQYTNNDTGEVFDDVVELYSQSDGGPTLQYFIFRSEPPAWLFDGTDRTGPTLVNANGTTPYADIVCFDAGTLIRSEAGEIPVQDLRVGMRVHTYDGALRPIRWIGSCTVTAAGLRARPKLRPIRIAKGALGQGLPNRDLRVSPQHRVLIRSKIAQRMFNSAEVLVPAIKLVGLPGITRVEDETSVAYFHILFDQHEVVFSNGAPTESLFTGPEALKYVSPEARAEILALFPDLIAAAPQIHARPVPATGKRQARLIHRHAKNAQPLFA